MIRAISSAFPVASNACGCRKLGHRRLMVIQDALATVIRECQGELAADRPLKLKMSHSTEGIDLSLSLMLNR